VDDISRRAEAMSSRLLHRGPDGAGLWASPDGAVALAHRRLAIVDLSEAGRQPMVSASGRYVLTYNGEIYNHAALRDELPPQPWRGHSDTETLLACIERWGLETALQKAVGMFALALWDQQTRCLSLARDRMGEKPLYYGFLGDRLLFGSELKALQADPSFRAEIDRGAVALLLRHNYIPAPHSIYRGVRKLPPGTVLHITQPRTVGEPQPYWSLKDVVQQGQCEPFTGSDAQATDMLEQLLGDAISLQSVADVPLGAFLSGGVDSSAVVALMQRRSAQPVRTFTIGFQEPEFNEAEYAMAVARHLGTEHTELYVSGRQALDVVPKLPTLYGEPFSDSSQIPTFLVSQMARQHVTVSLSGDAGDELFGGYRHYDSARRLWQRIGGMPGPLRALAAGTIRSLPPRAWEAVGGTVWPLLRRGEAPQRIGDRAHKLAEMLQAPNREALYRLTLSHQPWPERVVLGAVEPDTQLTTSAAWPPQAEFEERMMFLDQVSYLPDDILVKVDRAAMGVSLETRVPMLDHRLVEFAWRLPLNMKRRDGVNKWLLREVLYRHVPRALIDRPKRGFAVPLGEWLRGPLRDWAEALLDERRLREQGLLDPVFVRRLWTEQLAGTREWQAQLWDVLMLQAWLEVQ